MKANYMSILTMMMHCLPEDFVFDLLKGPSSNFVWQDGVNKVRVSLTETVNLCYFPGTSTFGTH